VLSLDFGCLGSWELGAGPFRELGAGS